jgi:hypothetical protein
MLTGPARSVACAAHGFEPPARQSAAAARPVALSVIIPTRNRPLLLRRALHSFAGVDGRVEIIVVDDGSSAANAASSRLACEQVAGCRYVRLARSGGASAARNHGLGLSRGAYLWFLDDDDYATARTVADVLDAVSSGTGCRILLMPRTAVLDDTPIATTIPADEADKLARYRCHGLEVTTSCALFPRSVLAQLNGWDERLRALQDTDLFLRAAEIATFACLRTEPVRVDVGAPHRITNSLVGSQFGKLRFLRKHWRRLPIRRRLSYVAQLLLCMPLLRPARQRFRLAAIRRRVPAAIPEQAQLLHHRPFPGW